MKDEVFTELEAVLKNRMHSLESSDDSVLKVLAKLKNIEQLSEDSSEKQLRNWAINLEILAEEIENCLPFIYLEVLKLLEDCCIEIVAKTWKKGENAQTKRERYRRRLRFAAGFILNIVEAARYDAFIFLKNVRDAALS